MGESSSKCVRGVWRAEVEARIGELRGRLKIAAAADAEGRSEAPTTGPAQPRPTRTDAVRETVEKTLDEAQAAVDDVGNWRCRLRAWWTGSAITEAWESVHNAELSLVSIEQPEDAEVIVPRLLAWIQGSMDAGTRRSHHEEALKKQLKDPKAFERVGVRQALADIIAANGRRYAGLRAFRNTLIIVTGMLALLICAIAGWHALNPNFISLCPDGSKACPVGTKNHGVDVALVAVVGALGGFLALAFGLAQSDAAPSRFDPKAWQAFLKPVTGAATALVGVMLLQAGFLIEPANTSESIILVYAVLFGFSQQLLTRFVDKRAESLITPS